MVNLRDRIFASDDILTELVDVPEWDSILEVRGMTGEARAAIMEAALDPSGKVNLHAFYPEIVIGCTYDPDSGERVFDQGDRAALMAKSGKAIDRLATVGLRLSGMTEEASNEAGKDSSKTESGDSTLS